MNEGENVVWKGGPSQVKNLFVFGISFLLVAGIVTAAVLTAQPLVLVVAVIPLVWALWKFLVVRCEIYELTTERMRTYRGVFNQIIDEIELYRVKDFTIEKPFWSRIFGLADVHVKTSDRSLPEVDMETIPRAEQLREQLRLYVERQRDRKRVREVDFEGEGGDALDMELEGMGGPLS